MLKFSDYLTEATIKDFVGGKNDSETERHRSQYYDDSHPDSSFNKIGGRYVLASGRTDIHPDFEKGKEIKLEKIEKRADSRGKIRYHGIIGDTAIPMSNFEKPKSLMKRRGDTLNVENNQISSIQSQIQEQIKKNGGNPIKMKMPDGSIHEVAGIKPSSTLTGGKNINAKADAYLHDKDGNPLHYMSLKGDTYQQWSGYKDVFNHPKMKEIISNFQKIKKRLAPNDNFLPAGSIYHHTLNKDDPQERSIILKAMYGRDHGSDYGINNVHAIYTGNTTSLKSSEETPGVFTLHTNAIHNNTNDENSDVTDAKVMLHKSSGHNQAETGGRVTIQHVSNVPSSTPINDGIETAIENRTKRKIIPLSKPIPKPERPVNSGMHAGADMHSPADKALARSMRGK